MCWPTKLQYCAQVKIAENDIKVFKIVKSNSSALISSYFYNKRYEIGKEYEESVNLFEAGTKTIVNQGLHSYGNEIMPFIKKNSDIVVCRIDDYVYVTDFGHEGFSIAGYQIMKLNCTIPKGSKYLVNERGEYVSERLRADSIEEL